MKNTTILLLALVAVMTLLFFGLDAMENNRSYGAFVTFIAGCSAVGLAIDLFNHIQLSVRKNNVRKLGRF